MDSVRESAKKPQGMRAETLTRQLESITINCTYQELEIRDCCEAAVASGDQKIGSQG
jgi:hypothetical protein